MKVKEVATLLSWTREHVKTAIEQGIATPVSKRKIKLAAIKLEIDYDISELDLDQFLNSFEIEEPGRYPPISVRRNLLVESRYKCGICRSDAPLKFHHILDWVLLKHHDPTHMLAVCGTCHDKIGQGTIDSQAQYEFKAKLNTPAAEASTSPPPECSICNRDEVIDASDAERVVWVLPRGFLMLENITFDTSPDRAIVMRYYHFGEGWRTGIHWHYDFLFEFWRRSVDLDSWCGEIGVPEGDRKLAYDAFDIAHELLEVTERVDVKSQIEPFRIAGAPVRHYERSEPIHSSHGGVMYPNLKRTHAIRDLLAEMERYEDPYAGLCPLYEDAHSFGHRATIEATKFLGGSHASLGFMKGLMDELDPNSPHLPAGKWIRRLRRILLEAYQSAIEDAQPPTGSRAE